MFFSRQMPYGIQNEKPTPARSANRSTGATVKPKPTPTAPVVSEDAAVTSHATQGSPQPDHAAQIVPVAYSPGVPLGLRYTLQKRDGDQTTDVAADTEFHSGDRIQLTVEVNDTGYLYIVSQGTSEHMDGYVSIAEIENGDNRVQRGHVYTVPPGYVIGFSGKARPGEAIRDFLAPAGGGNRQPDLLVEGRGLRSQPRRPNGKGRLTKCSRASARPSRISEIARMRAAYHPRFDYRKGDQEPTHNRPPSRRESAGQDKSVYVINPNGSTDTRVVADIPLHSRL